MPSRRTVLLLSLLLATPVVIFWLWLVILPAISPIAVQCPEGCGCDPRRVRVSCTNTTLLAVPTVPLTTVRYLTIDHNNIPLLKRGFFSLRGLTELKSLWVVSSGVRGVELGAFRGLTELKVLNLEFNKLSEIIPGTFGDVSKLEWLVLGGNRLQHLDSAVFSGLVNLQYMFLEGNRLQYVHPDTFLGSPKLERLSLSFNPDLQIPTDSNFINSHSLLHLYIRDCNVVSMSVETFTNVSALEYLDLSYNNLSTVDINILRALLKLSVLDLYGNRLQCDCQLQEVWRWCEDRNITTGGVVCDTPSELMGMGWGVLGEGQCVQGNISHNGDYGNTSYKRKKNTEYGYTTTPYTHSYKYYVDILKKYQPPVYAVLFIFGTTGNVFLLIIITCNKDMRTVPNMYIINLATSDIIYLTVFFTETCANTIFDSWLQGDFTCTFLPLCRRLSVGLSAYSVAVLSIQRYRVTVNPLHVRVSSQPTWRDIVAIICGVWIVAALFAVPSALSKYLCKEYLALENKQYYQLVVIFELLVSCVIPLCVITFTYTMTALHLKKRSSAIPEGTQNPQLNTRRNTANIVVGLTAVFMISYVPYHVLWTYVVWTVKQEIYILEILEIFSSKFELRHSYLISIYLLLINSCLNPVALFCTSSPFRQHLKRYLTCCCKTNSPPADIELARRN